jgi:hypothetical protein
MAESPEICTRCGRPVFEAGTRAYDFTRCFGNGDMTCDSRAEIRAVMAAVPEAGSKVVFEWWPEKKS